LSILSLELCFGSHIRGLKALQRLEFLLNQSSVDASMLVFFRADSYWNDSLPTFDLVGSVGKLCFGSHLRGLKALLKIGVSGIHLLNQSSVDASMLVFSSRSRFLANI
jgi:hypothetical protein